MFMLINFRTICNYRKRTIVNTVQTKLVGYNMIVLHKLPDEFVKHFVRV